MIKVKDGAVMLEGDASKLFIDLVCLLHSFLTALEEEMGRKDAEKLLTLAGKFAVLNEHELKEKFEEIVEEFENDSRM